MVPSKIVNRAWKVPPVYLVLVDFVSNISYNKKMPPKRKAAAAKPKTEAGVGQAVLPVPETVVIKRGRREPAKKELSELVVEIEKKSEPQRKRRNEGDEATKKPAREKKQKDVQEEKPEENGKPDDKNEGDENPKKKPDRKEKSDKKAAVKKPKEEKSVKKPKEKEPAEERPKRGEAKKKEDDGENSKAEKPTLANKTSSIWDQIDFSSSAKNAKGKTFNLKISSWNVGGLKSWIKKDCHKYLEHEKPDIFCLQETKCNEDKLPEELNEFKDYKQYWCSSDKDGYAGVGLMSVIKPLQVTYGINVPELDGDGRCITAEYRDYYVVCVYVPNAGRKLVTLPKRLDWNEEFKKYIKALDEKKPVVICGDMNVSHNEIDLARPKTNTKNAGFTREERDGMTKFLADGYVDTFRQLYPEEPDKYTFWTYMANARAKNVGWRLDYFIVSERIMKNVCDNVIRSEVFGSDHCPITLFLNV